MKDSSSGVFRSNHFLVIEPDNARFPSRCIWCDAPWSGELTNMTLQWVRVVAGPAVVKLGAAAMLRRSRVIPMPICGKCRKTGLRRGNIAAAIGIGSWVIAGILIAVLSYLKPAPQDPLTIGLMVAAVTLMTIGLIAVIVGALLQRYALKGRDAAHIGEKQIWMVGVNAQWLAALPEWHGESFAEASMN